MKRLALRFLIAFSFAALIGAVTAKSKPSSAPQPEPASPVVQSASDASR